VKTVVVDANIWISGLQFRRSDSKPAMALESVSENHIFATCDEMDAEIRRVLTEKFDWQADLAQAALDRVMRRSLRVKLQGNVSVCRDPKDDMLLECAARAKADLLLTGDRDLLVLGFYEGTSILAPVTYLAEHV
jgi:uncharacterized protein